MWETNHKQIDRLHIDKLIKYHYRALDELNEQGRHRNPAQQRALQSLIVQTLSELNRIKNLKPNDLS